MQKQIIPTILVKTFDEVKERIRAVENYVEWVQLDVMDGVFVKNATWPYFAEASQGKHNPNDLKDFKAKVKIEAHLMIENPEAVIDEWQNVADRIIVHFESKIANLESLIKKVHQSVKQIGLAINLETDYSIIEPFLKELDLVLLMAIDPGWGGQKFEEKVLEKIEALRKIWPEGNIEIDGGINGENIKRILTAGANLFNVGSYIYNSENIEIAIKKLNEEVK